MSNEPKEKVDLKALEAEMEALLGNDVVPEIKEREARELSEDVKTMLDKFSTRLKTQAEKKGTHELFYPVSGTPEKPGILELFGLPVITKTKDDNQVDVEKPVTALRKSYADQLGENGVLVNKVRNTTTPVFRFEIVQIEDDNEEEVVGEEEVSGEEETEAGLEEVGAITEEAKK